MNFPTAIEKLVSTKKGDMNILFWIILTLIVIVILISLTGVFSNKASHLGNGIFNMLG